MRMEDLDTPRNVPGAAGGILRTLKRFGMMGDEPVVYQSDRIDLYRAALERLHRAGHAYACSCSRREVGAIYPGTCRDGVKDPDRPLSWRVRMSDEEGGDFVVQRSDGVFAYQLAVVVDDAAQGITDVVRGADLLDSTPRQLHLQTLLGYSHPRYLHVPVAVNADGEKLSKQTYAPALNNDNPIPELREALRFLGQADAESTTVEEILKAAIENWNPDALPA